MGILSSSLSAAWMRAVALLATFALAVTGLALVAPAARADGLTPTIVSDQLDYVPGSNVLLSGEHWLPSAPVHIRVDDNVGAGWYLDSDPDPVADGDGVVQFEFKLPYDVIALYGVVATQTQPDGTVLKATTTFTDNAGGNIDQCANGDFGTTLCTGNQWQNGNLNSSNSRWVEGDSVPYRLILTGLAPNQQHSVIFEWDLKENQNWAYDYITTWNRTIGGEPCDDVTGFGTCASSVGASVGIPADAAVKALNTFNPSYTTTPEASPAVRLFAPAGETLTGDEGTYFGSIITSSNGDTTKRQFKVTFTSSSETVILAWAGHIAKRSDWGSFTAAAATQGSPYHMRFIQLDQETGGGNQDRSLKASSVISPSTLTIEKQTDPADAPASFGFTATGGLTPSSFNLIDDGQQPFTGITDFDTTFTVAEGEATGWTLTDIACSVTSGATGGTREESEATRTASVQLAEGQDVLCVFNNKADPKALTVGKTFTPTYTRTYSYDLTKDVDKTSVTIAEGGKATFGYTVNATSSYVDSAFGGGGTITVTNPNAGAVTGVTITDTTSNGLVCAVTNGTNRTIPAGGSIDLTYTCTPQATKPAAGTNTATATWSTQVVNGTNLAGGSATGTAPVAWTGGPTTIANQSVDVYDDKTTGADPSTATKIGTMSYTDESPKSFTYSLDLEGVGGTCTDYTNVAELSNGESDTETVEVCVGQDLSVSKTVVPSFGRDYDWTIDKSVDESLFEVPAGTQVSPDYTVTVDKSFRDSGYTAKGVITVSNPNDFESVTVDVTDAIVGGSACTVTGGDDLVVPAATESGPGTATATYECTLTSGSTVTNRATATWDKAAAHTPNGSDTFDALVSFAGVAPSITDGEIDVYDDQTDPSAPVLLGTVTYTDVTPKDFDYPLTFTAPSGTCDVYDNRAWFEIDGSEQDDDTAQVKVCGAVAPTATKLGTGTFDSEYAWDIDKVAGDKQTVPAGTDPIEVTYTVTVKQTGYSQSDASASGTITVTNANDWQAIEVAIEDSMGAGSTCTVEGVAKHTVTVPADDSVTVDWSCTLASAPEVATVKNTATITWNKTTAHTATESTTADADIDFTVGAESDKTVEVTDTFNLGSEALLGSVEGVASPDSEDWVEQTYNLTYEVEPTPGTCTRYPNLAELSTGGSADATAEVCVAVDLTIGKTAQGTYDEAFTWEVVKTATPLEQTVLAGTQASFTYGVEAKQTGYTQSGAEASGTITITNPNDFQAVIVDLSENLPGATCTVYEDGIAIPSSTGTIPADGSVELTYECSYANVPADKSVTNTAGITWDAAKYSTPSGSDSDPVDFTLELDESTDKVITVTDDFDGTGSNGSGKAELGTVTGEATFESTEYASGSWGYDQTVTAPSGTCLTFDNLAVITGDDDVELDSDTQTIKVCGASDVKVSKTATGTYDRAFEWEILKSVDQPSTQNVPAGTEVEAEYTVTVDQVGYSETGAEASGTITVENPNDFDPVTVSLSESLPGFSCTIYDATKTAVTSVLLGKAGSATDTAELTYACTAAEVPADKELTNTVTASWSETDLDSANQSADGEAEFTLALDDSIDEQVEAEDVFEGGAAEVLFTATGVATFDDTLWATESATYTRTVEAPSGECETFSNVATVYGDGGAKLDDASASFQVCGGLDLLVSKTATPTYTRTYMWDIAKAVDKTFVQIPAGTATFNYTVTASQTGVVDSGWKVTGTISISNPNTFQSVTVDVSDAIDNGGSCLVEGEASHEAVLAAGGTASLGYECTYPSTGPTTQTGTNTATITWDAEAAGTANGSDTGEADAGFGGATTSVNKTITVKDTFDGGTQELLGTVTGTDGTPFASRSFAYTRSVPAPAAGVCRTYNNTAVIVTPSDSASQSVRVCGPDPLGSRTIGFWQNKNGQGIIKAGLSTSGVCRSGTWLRQYAPFQDLSATASCATVATYVTTVIKAASARGTSMNPMLKAQMLATALDVYFSDPALGGNKLGAPIPIGPRVIDLTQICKYLGGTTCSGSLYDVSSVFGGSPKSVLQMLSYAASQSNVGGTVWYGQVKATQEKAKDAFDAINNDQVLVVG